MRRTSGPNTKPSAEAALEDVRRAAARPMPLAAPVTTATRPAAMAGWVLMA